MRVERYPWEANDIRITYLITEQVNAMNACVWILYNRHTDG